MGRWDNGKIIVELLDPVFITDESSTNARAVADQVHAVMKEKISQLDEEIAKGK